MTVVHVIIICSVIILALLVVLVIFRFSASKLTEELDTAEGKNRHLGIQLQHVGMQLKALEVEKKQLTEWLAQTDVELKWHQTELQKRVKLDRKTYRIMTLGMKTTGKSSLTLKWANPLVDLGTIEGTKIERYERTVSSTQIKDTLYEHVFEVHDWGGEHIVDAQQELIMEEIHGLLMVVDLGGKDARQIDPQRIAAQLDEFNPQALKYFFSPKTVASCKTVVLFINKSDLIPGPPAQAEAEAKKWYAPLIDSLHRYGTQIDVKVLVGSASYGHSTHVLFSHFVERILPPSAYDHQLLQRMRSELRQPQSSPPPKADGPTSQSPRSIPPPLSGTRPALGPIKTMRLVNGSNVPPFVEQG